MELQNVIVSMSVIQQRQTMSQYNAQSPVARFNANRSMSPKQDNLLHSRSINTRPKTSHMTQASITSKISTKSKTNTRSTFSRAKRMIDQQA